jgi:hypothetical protein
MKRETYKANVDEKQKRDAGMNADYNSPESFAN